MRQNVRTHPTLSDYAGRHKWLTYASLALSGVSAVFALVPFIYIFYIIRDVIEVAPDYGQAESVSFYGWMAVLFAALSILVYIGALMCSHIAAFRVAGNIKKRLLKHASALPLGVFDSIGSGRVRKIIDESSAATETYLAHNLPDLVGAVVTPLAMVALMFIFDWRLGLACIAPVIIAFFIMRAMTGRDMQEKMKQYNDALMDMNNEAVEYIRGVPVVKTFGQTVFSFARFKASIDRYHKWVVAYTKRLRQPMMFFTLCIDSVFAFIIAVALLIQGRGASDAQFISSLLFYIIFTPLLAVTINRIMFMSENGMIVKDAMNRVNSVLDMKPLSEPENPVMPAGNDVEIKHATFRYEGATDDAVKDISLYAKAGETIALVGESGSGKSTLAALTARFWDVDEGEIDIGGVNVKNIGTRNMSRLVSCVFQDSKLIKASIADNVRLGRPWADDAEVALALKAAQCEDIIAKLPEGTSTVIGREGVYLSGGEAQRIAIARAILKDSPVVVLDEATAFADPDNEYLVQKAIKKLTEGKTVIMIAHRLSTVTDADRIYVLSGGKVAEEGTHESLVQMGGIYSSMWRDYNSTVNWSM